MKKKRMCMCMHVRVDTWVYVCERGVRTQKKAATNAHGHQKNRREWTKRDEDNWDWFTHTHTHTETLKWLFSFFFSFFFWLKKKEKREK